MVNGVDYMENTKFSFNDFLNDAKNGELPDYSFIEPKFFGQHNDQHPSAENEPTRDGTVLLGEKLIWDVYNAVKNSTQKDETLLIITHDEHGGCFDHVAPPLAIPPEKGMEGDLSFPFNRLGIRVPMVMVSSFIKNNTIVNEVHDHTSFIKTMSEKWNFEGLTDRDKNAKSFASIFSAQKRDDYPEIPEPVIQDVGDTQYGNDNLNGLQKSILKAIHEIAKQKPKGENLGDVDKIGTVEEAIKHIEKLKTII
ncbi:MAG: alkaline phosphatase family protein [Flavobacteriales bacterium]